VTREILGSTSGVRLDQAFNSLGMADRLRGYARDYAEAKEHIPTGFKLSDEIQANQKRVKDVLQATEADWDDWRWQLGHRISTVDILEQIVSLTKEEKKEINEVATKFRWAISPYFASLMSPDDRSCPIRLQMVPRGEELVMTGVPDFSGEEYTSPVRNLVQWYPDRVAVHVTNSCAAFCRHCLRRRKIGEVDQPTSDIDLERIFDYLRQNREIRDVLLTGGDPLTFSDNKLDELLTRLDRIDHVEIKRLGSRIPVTLPQRITQDLCDMLATHHPLYINIQVNHPKEITKDTARVCDMLSRAGVVLGNQSVLLRGINDDSNIIKLLNHELLKIRVRPYYLYHCQGTIGIAHFRTPVEKGLEILENLRGFTSGLAVPDYIITPSGLGKTPLAPQYQISAGEGYVMLRNWEGKVYRYENPLPQE